MQEGLEQRGFADPVGADDADSLALGFSKGEGAG